MLLTKIHYVNYRAFKDATLPVSPLTLLIGPNSSGKTSALSAIEVMAAAARGDNLNPQLFRPVGMEGPGAATSIEAVWDHSSIIRFDWEPNRPAVSRETGPQASELKARMMTGRVFTLQPAQIASVVTLTKTLEVQSSGAGLPAVLTTLQDQWPERFDALNQDLRKWLPEFDRVLFDTPSGGQRAIILRRAGGGHVVPTTKLSAGTLLSLALLTICHLPEPPAIIGLEEPDYGIHPRLLRRLKDSLLRLTSPESFGESRAPVQVLATTHSPYLVDLFRDELESVVLVHKDGPYSSFTRLIDVPHVSEIVKDASLGEAWFNGILGEVPAAS